MNITTIGERIRFDDIQGISHAAWTILGDKLNMFTDDAYSYIKNKSINKEYLSEEASKQVKEAFKELFHMEYSENQVQFYKEKAVERFGLTTTPSLAGFILTDGSLLCLSESGDMRDMDHREIIEIIDFLPEDADPTQALIEFMKMGNIRVNIQFMCKDCCIDINRPLTDKQKKTLTDFIEYRLNKSSSHLYIDISDNNGDVIKSFAYNDSPYSEPITSERVVSDIEGFFGKVGITRVCEVFFNKEKTG